MRVLFLTTVLPGGRRSGGEVVSAAIVEALDRAGHSVAVVGYERPGGDPPSGDGEISAGARPIETSSARLRALAWMARAVAGGTPYSAEKFRSRAYAAATRRTLAEADVVVVDHAQTHWVLAAIEPRAPVVFVAHNAERLLYEALGGWAHRREARLIGAAEAELASRAAQTWTLTGSDAAYFRALEPEADVRALEVPARFTRPLDPVPGGCDVALLGAWSWRANAEGLDWFLSEVVPRLPPEVTVEVAGAGSERARGRAPNVVAHGVVPDPRAFLARARTIAVPAVTGGGVQVKTLDAIAAGVPVVATPFAVRELGELPASVAVADGGAAFAAALQRLASRADHEELRAEAVAWSHARRGRFEVAVDRWIAELGRGAAAPAVATQGIRA